MAQPNYMTSYLPILIQLVLAFGLALVIEALSQLIGLHRSSRVKMMPYECGITPIGDAQRRFAVKFYLVAIVFILFDIEAVFLIPWAVVFRGLGMFGFVEMVVYVAIVLVGFFYIWKRGVIDWNTPERSEVVHGD
jgi:NADH-quinone oxidoreductase subunit A